MSVRIELPAYSYHWSLDVSPDVTIADLKDEIFKTCPGNPRPAGQRLVCKGRILLDHETISQVWPSPEEVKVAHLAVNPSAWTHAPPSSPQAEKPASAPASTVTPVQYPKQSLPQHAMPSPYPHPLTFVLHKHQTALAILDQGKTSVINVRDFDAARAASMRFVKQVGWNWPPVLDEPIPPAEEGGATYDLSSIDGFNYLSLKNPGAEPTNAQLHALKLLNCTFPILFLPAQEPSPTRVIPSQQVPLPPNAFQHLNLVEQHFQQMGFNVLHAGPEGDRPANVNQLQQELRGNANQLQQELRGIILRQTFYSYIYLAFRTILLLYFVSPTRKPMFALLVLAYVLYEIWRPIQAGLNVAAARRRAQDAQQADAAAPAAPAANVAPGQAPPPQPAQAPQDAPQPVTPGATPESQIMENLAMMNIEQEDRILGNTEGFPAEPPTFAHKASTFIQLLLVTVHPALWNRRRTVLRRREGRIKTEANIRTRREEESPEGEEPSPEDQNRARARTDLIVQHARRPAWVREYIERVVSGDWVDDAD